MISTLLTLIALATKFTNGHHHEIIFMVNNGIKLSGDECATQQREISNYFKTFNTMDVDNVLSYISFADNKLQQVISFTDDQNVTTFNKSVLKVENFNCNPKPLNKGMATSNDGVLNALQYAAKTYYSDDRKTPEILLFNNGNNEYSDETVCKYAKKKRLLTGNNGLPIKVNVVNFISHGLDKHYLKCIQYPRKVNGTKNYNPFTIQISGNDFAYKKKEIIDSVCGSCIECLKECAEAEDGSVGRRMKAVEVHECIEEQCDILFDCGNNKCCGMGGYSWQKPICCEDTRDFAGSGARVCQDIDDFDSSDSSDFDATNFCSDSSDSSDPSTTTTEY